MSEIEELTDRLLSGGAFRHELLLKVRRGYDGRADRDAETIRALIDEVARLDEALRRAEAGLVRIGPDPAPIALGPGERPQRPGIGGEQARTFLLSRGDRVALGGQVLLVERVIGDTAELAPVAWEER